MNCYAETMAARFCGPGQAYEGTITNGKWNGTVKLVPEKLAEPLRWKRPRMVFVNSMSDLFHENVPFEYIAAVFGVMAAAPRHVFQVLTKRPERALEWFEWLARKQSALPFDINVGVGHELTQSAFDYGVKPKSGVNTGMVASWPLPNVWLGVSVEDQKTADERIPLLLQCPAAVRWVSYEPALGPVDFDPAICPECEERLGEPTEDAQAWCVECDMDGAYYNWLRIDYEPGIDWLVVGGESGQGARPFEIQWARSVIEQARGTGCSVFVKQFGSNPYEFIPPTGAPDDGGDIEQLRLKSHKGGDMDEWPEDLRVREWPEVVGGAE